MNKRCGHLQALVGLLMLTFWSRIGSAATIVDTGPGVSVYSSALALQPSQWLAGQFQISAPYLVTDIFGWIAMLDDYSLDARVALYDDSNDLPGSRLYSADFVIRPIGAPAAPCNPPTSPSCHVDWQGASGLSWFLAPGTYWISMEVDAAFPLVTLATMPNGSPRPLTHYAYFSPFQQPIPFWQGLERGQYVGYTVEGSSVVPAPSAVWLLGTALVGIGGRRWLRRKAMV